MMFEKMTVQNDHVKAKGNRLCRWKRSQALVRTFSLMTVSIVLVFAWESTRPSTLGFALETAMIQVHLGEAEKAQALFASTEQLPASGERMLRGDWERTRREIEGLNHDNPVQDLEEVPSRSLQQLQRDVLLPSSRVSETKNLREAQDPTEAAQIFKDIKLEANVCDFSKGYWVPDLNRPIYSGKECSAYLSRSWACRETNRPGFDYENLRWQPEGCDLPSFTGQGFLHRLRNKVVAFVGDSLGRQQFQSLMCMITEGKHTEEVEDITKSWGSGVSWAYRFRSTNSTVLFYWSASLCEIEYGNPYEQDGYAAMHLDRPATFLRDFFHLVDVLILNTGHHWNRGKLQSNKWHPYVNGKPLESRSKLVAMAEALNFTVYNLVQWLDGQLAYNTPKDKHPAVFLRTLSPRHFKNGDWDSGGTCDATRPADQFDSHLVRPIYRGPVVDRVAENAVSGTRVNLLNISHLSQYREEAHISKYGRGKDSQHQDCLHWCLPGVPDVWNELLYGYLLMDPSLSAQFHDQ